MPSQIVSGFHTLLHTLLVLYYSSSKNYQNLMFGNLARARSEQRCRRVGCPPVQIVPPDTLH